MKYEYKVIRRNGNDQDPSLIDSLNAEGLDGWELVGVTRHTWTAPRAEGSVFTFFFKRVRGQARW
jgi:hypothetical protein